MPNYNKKQLKTLLLRVKNKVKAIEYMINSGHRRSYIMNEIDELENRLNRFKQEAYQWASN